jgi:hypothetical protein
LGEVADHSFPDVEDVIRGPYLGLVSLLRHAHVDNPDSKRAKNLHMGEENDWSRAKTKELNQIRMKRTITNLE